MNTNSFDMTSHHSRNTFWKPSSSFASGDDLLNDDGGGGSAMSGTLNINYPLERQVLPINAHRTQILYALEKYGVLILVGETGCGKSTQLPQYFYENGWASNPSGGEGYREIVCTQPRRL